MAGLLISFLSTSQMLMSSSSPLASLFFFLPIRMTSHPRLWPALACPWKSCALWRVRVRVQRSSHPRKSSTESLTWVWLPDLHLSTLTLRPLSPLGNTLGRWSSLNAKEDLKCLVMEMRLMQFVLFCGGMCTKAVWCLNSRMCPPYNEPYSVQLCRA